MTMQCPVCRESSKTILKDRRLNLHQCNFCSHTFTIVSKGREEKYDEDYFFEIHKHWFNNPNYKLFDFIYEKLSGLLGNKQIQLLDVGCGKGNFLKCIAIKNPQAELFGIDLIYNQAHPHICFIEGDFFKEKIEAKFNIITILEVIEHIDNLHLFIQRLKDCLQVEGFLFITTIDSNSLIYRIARMLNKMGIHNAYDRLYSVHHLQHYTKQSLKTLMERIGFDVLLTINYNDPLKAVDIPKSSFLVETMNRIFVGLIFLLSVPFGCEMRQLIICRKKKY